MGSDWLDQFWYYFGEIYAYLIEWLELMWKKRKSADLNNLQMKSASAFNTPMSGTPIPTTTLSSETVELLNEAVNRLKDPATSKGKGVKRKRNLSPAASPDNRGNYPPATKPLYLKAKTLFRRKLTLATNIHSIKNSLMSGSFPVQCNFRSSPPISSDEDLKKSGWKSSPRAKEN